MGLSPRSAALTMPEMRVSNISHNTRMGLIWDH